MEVQDDQPGMIARSGAHSLFACLEECCPSTIRNDDPFIGRNGMTEVEYNKVLEKNGFAKVRDRTMERRERRGPALSTETAAALSAEHGKGQGHKVANGIAPVGVWGWFITNRSARASKGHHCIFGTADLVPQHPDPVALHITSLANGGTTKRRTRARQPCGWRPTVCVGGLLEGLPDCGA